MSNKYIFDIASNFKESKVVLLPIPFDTTSSYRKTSKNAVYSILNASVQVDLFDIDFGNVYRNSVYMEKISTVISQMNQYTCELYTYLKYVVFPYKGCLEKINELTILNNLFIYKWTLTVLSVKKIPIIIGGEHGVIFGSVKACVEKYRMHKLTLFQIDAHSDLHQKYCGYSNSHASVIHNIIKHLSFIRSVVQIGIRALSYNEYKQICLNPRIYTLLDSDVRRYRILGSFDTIADIVISKLSRYVYVTIDVDGLDILYSLNTGTPVPGGFSFDHIIYILKKISFTSKKIVAADICETASVTIDSIVAIRLLYKLIGILFISNK
jgi:agmatinase